METERIILHIEVGGHRLTLDRRESYFRVNCNGVTHATFNAAAIGDVKALGEALAFFETRESDALKYPKPPA